jgi:ribose 5-phosphate isomerase A
MSSNMPTADEIHEWKQQAADRATQWIAPGMVIGLGSGSTSLLAVRRIGALLADGTLRDIAGLPTSAAVEAEARRLGIPLVSMDHPPSVDLTIDGADEVDPALNLIKGGGGALLREKFVAQLSRREVIIVDETKVSPKLGTLWPVPVEVVPFGWGAQQTFLEDLGASVAMRRQKDGQFFKSDQGNLILDCTFGPIANPQELAHALQERAGIVEHGLFLGLATDLIVAGRAGVEHRVRP